MRNTAKGLSVWQQELVYAAEPQNCDIMALSVLLHLLVCTLLSQGAAVISGSPGNETGGGMCPTWFIAVTEDNVTTCKCGSDLRQTVLCSESPQKVQVSNGYCMTHWNSVSMTVAGRCPYNYLRNSSLYLEVSNNASQLDDSMCGALNREGLLCGQCKSGFYPAVYSYDSS